MNVVDGVGVSTRVRSDEVGVTSRFQFGSAALYKPVSSRAKMVIATRSLHVSTEQRNKFASPIKLNL